MDRIWGPGLADWTWTCRLAALLQPLLWRGRALRRRRRGSGYITTVISIFFSILPINVGPDLMEGFGLMKSFGEIIQNQLLFEGFGIMKSCGDRN